MRDIQPRLISFLLFLVACAGPVAHRQATAADLTPGQKSLLQATVTKGVQFLKRARQPNGSFSPELGPGITALVTTAVVRSGVPAADPLVADAIQYLEGFARDDGGIYAEGSLYRNYETCLVILCLTEAGLPRHKDLLRRANDFVRSIQWDEDRELDPSSPAYGGAGYGKHKRPDLSNTGFLIEALKSMGADENDPDMQKALAFVLRTQNMESEYNTLPFSTKIEDGGFYYTPAAGGSSQAGTTANGGLRSYGSMTYVGLKSMIYAGMGPDDGPVKAALEWIRMHYRLDENPGMGGDGLFYYYHTFAKSLHALGEDVVMDANGKRHDWRADLLQTLAAKQRDDGSWVNDRDRWLEGDASLVTGYALLSLSYLRPSAE